MICPERKHFETLNNLLVSRSIRHCYALRLWAFGGFSLGLITAIIGRNAIWICTDSVETTVLHHLDWQLEFLHKHDSLAYDAVLTIKADEESHQDFGHSNSTESFIYKPIFLQSKNQPNLQFGFPPNYEIFCCDDSHIFFQAVSWAQSWFRQINFISSRQPLEEIMI